MISFQPIERKDESSKICDHKEDTTTMVTITEIAEQKIKELIKEEENAVGLRIYVKGGGCSGYQYGMSFEDKTGDDDTIIEKGDVKVIVDSQSAPMLSGAEVDYVDSLQGSGFAIKNPQAKSTCGCGSSFSA
jgi:iron-sulfur cluster insertion protein